MYITKDAKDMYNSNQVQRTYTIQMSQGTCTLQKVRKRHVHYKRCKGQVQFNYFDLFVFQYVLWGKCSKKLFLYSICLLGYQPLNLQSNVRAISSNKLVKTSESRTF